MEPNGTSVVVGALLSKTWLSVHVFWYFFSVATRVSRLSVYNKFVVSEYFPVPETHTYVLELQRVFRGGVGVGGRMLSC
jgi:hypothetical protein